MHEPGGSRKTGCDKKTLRESTFFNDSKKALVLDEHGFPAIAIANRILVNRDDYGESKEDLAINWEKWVHHIPFDTPVVQALAKLYERKLENLDKDKDAAEYQRLMRKLKLARSRLARYSIDSFL